MTVVKETSRAVSAPILLTIGVLYVSQGIPMGLGFVALPAILREAGYATENIGLLGLILIPWAIKFLWAPIVDRWSGGRFGARRSWIIPAQITMALLYFVIALLPVGTTPLWYLLLALMIANFVSATQDVATDGLAVEALRNSQYGAANGLQIGGFSLGMVIGGSLSVIVYAHGGWFITFSLLAFATFLSLLPVLLIVEPRERPRADLAQRPSLATLFRRPGAWIMLSIAATFHFALTMQSSMGGPFMVDAGLSLIEIGTINGTATAIIAIVGAIVGSLLVRSFGAVKVAIVSGFASACALALWIWPAYFNAISFSETIAITAVNGLASGIAYVAFFSLFMSWASTEQAGTDFTVLQCTESCTNILAAVLAGYLASALKFAGLFTFASALATALLCWIVFALHRLRKIAHTSQ